MNRDYDVALVDAIAQGAHTVDSDGLTLEIRPIPDDDRENVLDPRVLAYTRDRLANPVEAPDQVARRMWYSRPNHQFDDFEVEERFEMIDLPERYLYVHILVPAQREEKAPLLLFCHGGGFIEGTYHQTSYSLRYLAGKSGAIIVYPEYRYAPETPFPGPLEDCAQTLDWAIDHADELGIDTTKIAVAGDSAGGSLAIGVTQLAAKTHPVALTVPIYAVTDCSETWLTGFSEEEFIAIPEQQEEANNRYTRTMAEGLGLLYTHGDLEACKNPLISGMYIEDTSCFGRVVLAAGQYDFLRIQDELFAKKLQDAGVDVRAIRYLGMDHGFFENGGTGPQAEDLANIMAEEIAKL